MAYTETLHLTQVKNLNGPASLGFKSPRQRSCCAWSRFRHWKWVIFSGIFGNLDYWVNTFVDAKPSTEELDLYNHLSAILVQPTPALLASFKQYQSASDLIREAIANPTTEKEDRAWDAVLPIVDMLRDFYAYAQETGMSHTPEIEMRKHVHWPGMLPLEEKLPQLLNVLCQGDVNKNLERHQGLTKLFADILDFVFEFDYLKVGSQDSRRMSI